MRAIFVSIVAGILALSMVGTGYATEYPVRWTSEVKLKDLKEIDALLNKPGFAGLGEDYPLTMELGGDQIAAGKVSCNEYFYLKYQGYEPSCNAAQEVEGSSFKIPCNTLQYLKKAQPSKVSFLQGFKLTDNPLKNLPLTLGLYLSSDEAKEVSIAREKRLTWKEFAPTAKVEVEDPNNISIDIQDSDGEVSGTYISLLAWGDFNGDGVEDILLSVTHTTGGSYHDFAIAAITKIKKDGRITQLMTPHLQKLWKEE